MVVPSSRTVPLIAGPAGGAVAGVGATPLAEIGVVFVPLVWFAFTVTMPV
jgi:hypothetical protein